MNWDHPSIRARDFIKITLGQTRGDSLNLQSNLTYASTPPGEGVESAQYQTTASADQESANVVR